jgi:hypothetical protein
VLECRHVLVFGIKELPARINFLHSPPGKTTELASAACSLAMACWCGIPSAIR